MKSKQSKLGRRDTGLSALFVLVLSLSLSACKGIDKKTGGSGSGAAPTETAKPAEPKPPVIESATPESETVEVGDTTESNIIFSVTAKAEAEGELNYKWSVADAGSEILTELSNTTNLIESWDLLNVKHEPEMVLNLTVTDPVSGLSTKKSWNLSFKRKAVFVRSDGADNNNGTRWSPVKTFLQGYILARDLGIDQVQVAKGTYSAQGLALSRDIDLKGAYSIDFRKNDPLMNDTILQTSAMGILFQEINAEKLEVSGFIFSSMKSTDYVYNPNSLAVRVWKSKNLEFKNNKFMAADGMDGANGAPGLPGASGPAGVKGGLGVQKNLSHNEFGLGGNGGSSICGSSGGRGGDGAKANSSTPLNASPGNAGSSSQFFLGGQGGSGGASTTIASSYGGDGMSGLNGLAGASGNSGAHSSSLGYPNLSAFGWKPSNNAQYGINGINGGGGGGGGGGGAYVITFFGMYYSGNGGSGGGSGGCGGTGGQYGLSGGGSISVMVIDSTDIVFSNNVFKTANGGKGGNGGEGGVGGQGGYGGERPEYTSQAGTGGSGGRGGNGGNGGKGGSGAGGPSIGLMMIESVVTESSNVFELGSAGAAGTGGQTGIRQDKRDVQL